MYKITEVLNDVKGKFTCMVEFAGQPAQRYEVESLDSAAIDEVLKKTDEAVAASLSKPADKSVEVKDGLIVVPVVEVVAEALPE
jgi:hypothetical protein